MMHERELLAAMKEIVKYAILTLAVQTDPDAKYLGLAKLPMHVVHDVKEAYGYASVSVRSFHPTARHVTQMELLNPWLAWLRREHGDLELRRLMGWAMGAPMWGLADRERVSDETIRRRIDRSIARMVEHFVGASLPVEYGEEPIENTPFAIIHEPLNATSTGEIKLMRIYVGGKGMWKAGKYQDNRHRRFKETA